MQWLGVPENFERIRSAFNSSSRFASLQAIKTAVAGRSLFLRFACTTGDAMGMNMVSKGTQKALAELATVFPDTKLVSMPYSLCTAVRFAPLTILFRCFRSAFQAIIAATRSLLPSTGLKGVAKVWLRRQLCPAVSSRTFSKPLLTAWSRPTYSRTTSAPLLQVQLVVSMPMPLIWLPLFSLQLKAVDTAAAIAGSKLAVLYCKDGGRAPPFYSSTKSLAVERGTAARNLALFHDIPTGHTEAMLAPPPPPGGAAFPLRVGLTVWYILQHWAHRWSCRCGLQRHRKG